VVATLLTLTGTVNC